jgi:hypothetical protein
MLKVLAAAQHQPKETFLQFCHAVKVRGNTKVRWGGPKVAKEAGDFFVKGNFMDFLKVLYSTRWREGRGGCCRG